MIEINGMPFEPVPGVKYPHNYLRIHADIASGKLPELDAYRAFIQKDLFFIVYFVLKIPNANHPFVVQACKDVMKGPKTKTVDLWAREHFKSTIITTAETIQDILNNPEERIAIFSYVKPIAVAFLRQIKQIFEKSDLLKACFPDVLYQDPQKESDKWSDDGFLVKRTGFAKELTLEAYGLTEGMPTSRHYTKRIYDDIVTLDLVQSPEMMEKVKENFDMSLNLGSDGDRERVIGTYYHHSDPLVYIVNKKDPDGNLIYETRVKPATDDGTPNGKSVLLSEEKLAEKKANPRTFYTQQLLDPTPKGTQKLHKENLVEVFTADIPQRLFKFMVIDPAGERKDRVGDAWSIMVAGVEPYRDDLGASDVYILDMVIEVLTQEEAFKTVVDMYCRNGVIRAMGVEKVGISTAEVHIANALRARGKLLTVEAGTLVLLRPAGRQKADRIEANVAWPLNNGKIKISAAVPVGYRERLKLEMEKFPFWHDDGLDTLSYLYDMVKTYKFGKRPEIEADESYSKIKWRTPKDDLGWMTV